MRPFSLCAPSSHLTLHPPAFSLTPHAPAACSKISLNCELNRKKYCNFLVASDLWNDCPLPCNYSEQAHGVLLHEFLWSAYEIDCNYGWHHLRLSRSDLPSQPLQLPGWPRLLGALSIRRDGRALCHHSHRVYLIFVWEVIYRCQSIMLKN